MPLVIDWDDPLQEKLVWEIIDSYKNCLFLEWNDVYNEFGRMVFEDEWKERVIEDEDEDEDETEPQPKVLH